MPMNEPDSNTSVLLLLQLWTPAEKSYMHAMLLSLMNKGRDVVYTISLVRSSDRVDTPGMTEAKSE